MDKTMRGAIPELFAKKEQCCGCTACYSVCPAGAISMEADEEGFLYPSIDPAKCIGCGACKRVCAFQNGGMDAGEPRPVACVHRDPSVREASRSGGAFTALSDEIFARGGVVYGCELTEDLKAVHRRAESRGERDRMRGSKYVQSRLGDTFRSVREDLRAGREVLFSGTSCQVAGLKSFLGREEPGLCAVDLLCLGVPSPLVFDRYLKWQEERSGGKSVAFDFRNKRDFGWAMHVETLTTEDSAGRRKRTNSRVYSKLLYGRCVLRPSCYVCPYKSVRHPGDLTIADYWGIGKAAPEFDDNGGASLVLVNSERGRELFSAACGSLLWKETRMEDSMQPVLRGPVSRPAERERFWEDFAREPFSKIARRYGGENLKSKVGEKLRRMKKRIQGRG